MTETRRAAKGLIGFGVAFVVLELGGCGGAQKSASPASTAAANSINAPVSTATSAAPARPSGGALAVAVANPCSLITLGEAQALFGGVGMQPTTLTSGVLPSCTYRDVKGDHDLEVSIVSSIVTGNKGVLKSPQPVSGLGHEAYCDPRDAKGDIADLFVGIDSGHTLNVIEQSGGTSCDLAAQFAQKALARLSSGTLATTSSSPPAVAGGTLANASAYPCSIVTGDEAAAIFGTAVRTTQLIGTPRPVCQWFTRNMSMLVSIFGDTIASAKSQLSAANPVNGLGAEAYCDPGRGSADLVVAIDANHYLDIMATTGTVTCDSEQQFAQKALPRL